MMNAASDGFETDYLVIGGGIAGTGVRPRGLRNRLRHGSNQGRSTEANTNYAQGGIASVWSVD